MLLLCVWHCLCLIYGTYEVCGQWCCLNIFLNTYWHQNILNHVSLSTEIVWLRVSPLIARISARIVQT